MGFEELRSRYAELIVAHGLNVQKGQDVQISAEVLHRDLALDVAEHAYRRGARHVELELVDPRLLRVRLMNSRPDDLDFVPPHVSERVRHMVDERAAFLKLVGSEAPEILSDLSPVSVNRVRMARHHAIKYFYDVGIDQSQVHWTVAAAATPVWAQKVFGDLEAEQAEAQLWRQVFSLCRVDRDDFLDYWREHNERLHARCARLNDLEMSSLRFHGGGSDLAVGLSERALFRGGTETGARGVDFEPNLPTEEVFTTPDWRRTEGTVRATRPFLVNGTLVRDLELLFSGGVVRSASASAGLATLEEYMDSDAGGRRLGEVALVGVDSPVYESGLVFEEILFDENAACHIAVGSAYKSCIRGATSLDEKQLDELGVNESSVHTDMMISSEQVHVDATTRAGEEIRLLEHGRWVI